MIEVLSGASVHLPPAASRAVPSSSGLGHHPLKVETRVQIPLGLRRSEGVSPRDSGQWSRLGPAAYAQSVALKRFRWTS
jgi:hypothetical protein